VVTEYLYLPKMKRNNKKTTIFPCKINQNLIQLYQTSTFPKTTTQLDTSQIWLVSNYQPLHTEQISRMITQLDTSQIWLVSNYQPLHTEQISRMITPQTLTNNKQYSNPQHAMHTMKKYQKTNCSQLITRTN